MSTVTFALRGRAVADNQTITVPSVDVPAPSGEVLHFLPLDSVSDLLDAWQKLDPAGRSHKWPASERQDDDVIVSFVDARGEIRLETVSPNEAGHWRDVDLVAAIDTVTLHRDDPAATDQPARATRMKSENEIRDLIKQPMRSDAASSMRISTLEEVLGYGYLGDGYWEDGTVDPDGTF